MLFQLHNSILVQPFRYQDRLRNFFSNVEAFVQCFGTTKYAYIYYRPVLLRAVFFDDSASNKLAKAIAQLQAIE